MAPRWWDTVRLLLATARLRRQARLRDAMKRRGKRASSLGYGAAVIGNVLLQGFMAAIFIWLGGLVQTAALERQGRDVISKELYAVLQHASVPDRRARDAAVDQNGVVADAISREAIDVKFSRGDTTAHWNDLLVAQYRTRGLQGFVAESRSDIDGALYRALALFLVVWWLSLVLQGEGFNLDSMRRRHPMWEWYLGFPVPQSAVFVAEALAPAVSNPFLLVSPVLFAVLVGWLGGSFLAGLAALPLGVPLLIAATLWAKALEVLILLRSPLRNRGAWFVLMSGAGYVALIGPMLFINAHPLAWRFATALAPYLGAVPSSRWLLAAADPASWIVAMATSLAVGLLLALPAVAVMRFAAARGLEAGFGSVPIRADEGSFRLRQRGLRGLLSDPLLRKEWLWLKRDRGAILQLIGVPLILLLGQSYNVQNILRNVDMTWNHVAGVVFFFATMLLASAGPRTLIGEGPALQLTLSWPRSLEDTLRMKVHVLFALVTAMVWICIGTTIWLFPRDASALVGVAVLWPLFALSVAEKSVTLIQAPSASGESTPVPAGQRYAATLGNSTFAVAVFMGLWPLAFTAIATNWVFAGALWQRFRVRIAYLFDPVSEPEVRPPTILSSVIAIVGMQELGALLTVPFLAMFGKDGMPFALAVAYGCAALVACIAVDLWQEKSGVYLREVVTLDPGARLLPWGACAFALSAGALLAIVGVGYQLALPHVPWPALHDVVTRGARFMNDNPNARVAYALMAVGIAPWAEEFLFRGLMFRAMREHWGVARATLASAAFFTVLHPWPAWPMVFVLGAGNALLYARSRSLVPCVIAHAAYNGVLLWLTFRAR